MKFFFFFAVCLLLAFSSCKKQGVAPGAISATFDGVDVNLSSSAFAQKFFDSAVKEYVVDITGSTGTGNGSIVINVTSYSPITTGPYVSNSSEGKDPFSSIITSPQRRLQVANRTFQVIPNFIQPPSLLHR